MLFCIRICNWKGRSFFGQGNTVSEYKLRLGSNVGVSLCQMRNPPTLQKRPLPKPIRPWKARRRESSRLGAFAFVFGEVGEGAGAVAGAPGEAVGAVEGFGV